jgi:hypothetical protein
VFVRGFSLYLFPTRLKKAQTVFHEEGVKVIATCGRHGSTPWRPSPADVEIIDNPVRGGYTRSWPAARHTGVPSEVGEATVCR